MKHPDVIVVGGGVIGICSAYFLAQSGHKVQVLDRGSIGGGSSFANAGLIVPSHATPLSRPGVIGAGLKWLLDPASPFYIRPRLDLDLLAWLWRFYRASRPAQTRRGLLALHDLSTASAELFARLVETENLDCGYQRHGLLMPCRTHAGFDAELEDAARLQAASIQADILNGAQAKRLEPALRSDLPGAVFFPEDAHLDPQAFVVALADRAAALGVELCPGEEVLRMRRSSGGVIQVETAQGIRRPGTVVLAAGAWSVALARPLGLSLPVQAAKGYSLTYAKTKDGPARPLLLVEDRVAVTPLGDRLRLAGTLEFSGLDLALSRGRLEAVAAALPRYLDVDPVTVEAAQPWAGLRPVTPDGLPLIGEARQQKNLLVATGHAMLGMALGPVTGKLVAEMVSGALPSLDVSPYQVNRFEG